MNSVVTAFVALLLIATIGCGGAAHNSNLAASGANTSQASTSDPSGSPAASYPDTNASSIPHSDHVFLIMEENQSFANMLQNKGMPFLDSLSQYYAYAGNYTSNSGGSMLDYLWLSSGSAESNYGCEGWGCPNQMTKPIADDNIFRELTKAGLTWKVYAESLPSVGWLADGPAPYTSRHNPAVWYSDIVNSPEQQKNVVPFSEFATDMANGTLPNYSIIIPNLNNDAHDGTPAMADTFLWGQVQPVFKLPMFNTGGNALMFITFDECAGGTNAGCGGHVLTTVIGPQVKKEFVSNTPYSHPNALRTMMEALGLKTFPGAAATSQPMSDFFQ